MEFKNGDRVIDKKTGKKGVFTEYDWACKDLAWLLYDGEKEERKALNHDLEIVKEKEDVFSWIDYEENSALFVEGIGTNVAILRHKDFRLSLSITNYRSSLKLMYIELVMLSSHLILCRPFSSCPQSLPASESFPMSQLFT